MFMDNFKFLAFVIKQIGHKLFLKHSEFEVLLGHPTEDIN